MQYSAQLAFILMDANSGFINRIDCGSVNNIQDPPPWIILSYSVNDEASAQQNPHRELQRHFFPLCYLTDNFETNSILKVNRNIIKISVPLESINTQVKLNTNHMNRQ